MIGSDGGAEDDTAFEGDREGVERWLPAHRPAGPSAAGGVEGPGDEVEALQRHALLSAHANHLVAPIQRVLDHVLPELPGGTDDADPHRVPSVAPWTSGEPYLAWTIASIGFSC